MPELATPFVVITSQRGYENRPKTPPIPASSAPKSSLDGYVEWSDGNEMHAVESIILPLSVMTCLFNRLPFVTPAHLMTFQKILLVLLFLVLFYLAWNLTPTIDWEYEDDTVQNDDDKTANEEANDEK
ncbi:hypothetical protein TrST_g256 [Triparma strigata]|uniref:Uncharacterized protein n=1 Tax=Triparma strigata TaxID=1606541 RepID=A0A9W7BDP9_9STRA|nr:hypothetical protein TrST_g256 [Triparma strigata]